MKNRYMRILAVVCILFIVGAAQAAKAPAKSETKKATPVATTTAPAKPTSPNSTIAADAAASAGIINPESNPDVQSPKAPRAGEEINWDVIASGGGMMSSAGFILNGTLGQTVAGESSSPGFVMNAGFWQNFGTEFLCGDVNASGSMDIADVVYLVNYIFASGPAPSPIESADVNCTGSVDISDVVYMVNYIFASGPAPCASCP